MSRHRCYVPDAAAGLVELPVDEAHHLARVLRAEAGSEVAVFDGHGREWLARVASIERRRVTVELLERRTPVAEPAVSVTLAAALLRGDQMNSVVRDATALGAAAIQPFVSAHVAVPERAWRDRSAERWRRIAIASAKQCGRAVVPEIRDVARLSDLWTAGRHAMVVVCVEPGHPGASTNIPAPAVDAGALVCVGPEGGWAREEVAEAQDRGARLLSLGPRILRAEIAPTVALTTLWTLWGW